MRYWCSLTRIPGLAPQLLLSDQISLFLIIILNDLKGVCGWKKSKLFSSICYVYLKEVLGCAVLIVSSKYTFDSRSLSLS